MSGLLVKVCNMRVFWWFILVSVSFIWGNKLQANIKNLDVVFIEKIDEKVDFYTIITADKRVKKLNELLRNDQAEFAIELYQLAYKATFRDSSKKTKIPPLYIAVEEGGNYADTNLNLKGLEGSINKVNIPFIRLGENQYRFSNTLLHEMGHVILYILNNGKKLSNTSLASIPHSTSAITDRSTAFDEGFAIHLETIFGHLTNNSKIHSHYLHKDINLSDSLKLSNEFFFHSTDLLTFSQSYARYRDIVDNNYSFQSAYKDGDYVRVQLEKSRDFSELRNADQLLASEGFYASYFFRIFSYNLNSIDEQLFSRYSIIFKIIKNVLAASDENHHFPYLLHISKDIPDTYIMNNFALLLLFDLSHGAFFLDNYRKLWKSVYLNSLKVEYQEVQKILKVLSELKLESISKVSTENSNILYKNISEASLIVTVPNVIIELKEIEPTPQSLRFDLNTVQKGVLKLIPAIENKTIDEVLYQRDISPFKSVSDFLGRVKLPEHVKSEMKF